MESRDGYQILCTVREVSIGEALDWLANQLDYEFKSGDVITRIEHFQIVGCEGVYYVAATCTVQVNPSITDESEVEMTEAEQEIEVLANYIMREIPGEPSLNQGAGDTAVRLLKRYRFGFKLIMDELGVPDDNYPAPVANARAAAKAALGSPDP